MNQLCLALGTNCPLTTLSTGPGMPAHPGDAGIFGCRHPNPQILTKSRGQVSARAMPAIVNYSLFKVTAINDRRHSSLLIRVHQMSSKSAIITELVTTANGRQLKTQLQTSFSLPAPRIPLSGIYRSVPQWVCRRTGDPLAGSRWALLEDLLSSTSEMGHDDVDCCSSYLLSQLSFLFLVLRALAYNPFDILLPRFLHTSDLHLPFPPFVFFVIVYCPKVPELSLTYQRLSTTWLDAEE